MTNHLLQIRNGRKYFKTIHGNWIKVLWVGLGSIRIAYLNVDERTRLIKSINSLNKQDQACRWERTMINAALYKSKSGTVFSINPDRVETTPIAQDEFLRLVAI